MYLSSSIPGGYFNGRKVCFFLYDNALCVCYRYWQGLKQIVKTLSELTVTILSLTGLVGSLLIFFSLLGMRLFGTRLVARTLPSWSFGDFENTCCHFYGLVVRLSVGGHHHPNYNNFIGAILLVFQVMVKHSFPYSLLVGNVSSVCFFFQLQQLFTTENWDRVLETTISSYGYYSEEIPELEARLVSIYYVIVIIIGGRILW